MKKIFLPFCLFLIAGLLSSCGDSPAPTPDQLVGTYALEKINGDPLPASLLGYNVTEGVLTMNADGTYESTLSSPSAPDTQDDGTYTQDGSQLGFDSNVTGPFDGSAGIDTIEMSIPIPNASPIELSWSK